MERDEHILLIVYIRCLNDKYLDIYTCKRKFNDYCYDKWCECASFDCNMAISESYFALHDFLGLCNKMGLYFEKSTSGVFTRERMCMHTLTVRAWLWQK